MATKRQSLVSPSYTISRPGNSSISLFSCCCFLLILPQTISLTLLSSLLCSFAPVPPVLSSFPFPVVVYTFATWHVTHARDRVAALSNPRLSLDSILYTDWYIYTHTRRLLSGSHWHVNPLNLSLWLTFFYIIMKEVFFRLLYLNDRCIEHGYFDSTQEDLSEKEAEEPVWELDIERTHRETFSIAAG